MQSGLIECGAVDTAGQHQGRGATREVELDLRIRGVGDEEEVLRALIVASQERRDPSLFWAEDDTRPRLAEVLTPVGAEGGPVATAGPPLALPAAAAAGLESFAVGVLFCPLGGADGGTAAASIRLSQVSARLLSTPSARA